MALRRLSLLGAHSHRSLALLGSVLQPLSLEPASLGPALAAARQLLAACQQLQHVSHFGMAAAAALPVISSPALPASTASGSPVSVTSPAVAAAAAAAAISEEEDKYVLRIVTGNLRGAGTQSAASVQLVGLYGTTPKYVVGDCDATSLIRGSTRTFEIAVPRAIGPLRRVHVEKERDSLFEAGSGWYLKQVELDSPTCERIVFPCNQWLGESDCGDVIGSLERNLLPAVVDVPEVAPVPITVVASGMSIPHPEKIKHAGVRGVNRKGFGYGGEDAYFFCHGRNGVFGMGVADGVYMWKEVGIDSGRMSRALMETASHMVAQGHEDVYKVMHNSARYSESEGLEGSSTACIITLNTLQGQLHAANLGDSGFLIIGPQGSGSSGSGGSSGSSAAPGSSSSSGSSDASSGVQSGGSVGDAMSFGLNSFGVSSISSTAVKYELKLRTNQLEHEFGCPFQLGHHKYANSVNDADLNTYHVHAGDVIVMGTDGLLDNVADGDIVREVTRCRAKAGSPATLVQRLVKLAFEASMDRKRSTPYSKGASEAFDMVYSGGKPDDITVLVAFCE